MTSHRRKHNTNDRERMFLSQKGKCWWCKKDCLLGGPNDGINQNNYFTVDHIIPLGCFGTNHWRNLVGACYECNQARDQKWKKERVKIRWFNPSKHGAYETAQEVSTFSLAEKLS